MEQAPFTKEVSGASALEGPGTRGDGVVLAVTVLAVRTKLCFEVKFIFTLLWPQVLQRLVK